MEFTSYNELIQYINDNENEVEYMLDYDFKVVEIQGDYWYFDNDNEFYNVELIAELNYSTENDIKIKPQETLDNLFDCDVCGEKDIDEYGNIQYLWFKEIKGDNN